MEDYKYDQHEINISSPTKAVYSHMLDIPTKYGWKTIEEKRPIIEVQSELGGLKLKLESQQNTEVAYNKIETKCNIKKGTSHYTEASLIKKLEDLGIGRPSTYASLIDTLYNRNYTVSNAVDNIQYTRETNTIDTRHYNGQQTLGKR